jgi:4-amino-4-deoxy-L-arabinose transferase-like glycosyltransferase
MKGQFGTSQHWKGLEHPIVARSLPILWVAFLSLMAFFNGLGSIGLVDETEPLFAEAGRQMTVTGNWITPYFNGVTRFDKPPLIYWLMAIAYHTIGVNEWGARLPSALAGTILIGFVFYALNKLRVSALTPYLGSAIAALNLMMLFFGRLGYSDMLLNACFGGSLLSFFLGYVEPQAKIKTRWYLGFYVLMALAVLTKGPVGVVLPVAIVGIFLLWVGKFKEVLREIKPILGTGIFLLISVPWYILVYLQNGSNYINSFFGVHNIERFTSVVNQHSGSWYYHLVIVLFGFFPWSLTLPASIAHIVTQKNWHQQSRSQHLGRFTLIWFSVVLGFFTIAVTKYITYTLPLFPAAAILVTLWWEHQLLQNRQSFWLKFTVYISIAFSIALAICALYSPNWLNDDPSMPTLGARLQASGLPWIAALIWAGAAIAGCILAFRNQLRWFWNVNFVAIAAFIVLFITPGVQVVDTERQLPLRQIAQTVTQIQRANEPIVMATNSFEKPSLVFYARQNMTFLNRADKIQPYLEEIRATQKVNSIVLITTQSTLEEAKLKPERYEFIQQRGVYQLMRVSLS